MDEQRNQWVSSLLQLEEQTRRANEELIMMHERLNRVDHSLVANKDIRDRQEKLAAVQVSQPLLVYVSKLYRICLSILKK